MKKFLLLLNILIIIISCNEVLDLKPLDRLSEKDLWQDENLIQAYINANYHSIPHGFPQGMLAAATDEIYDIHNASGGYLIQRGELTSDNVSSLSSLINNWNHSFSYLRNINIFFENIDDAPINDSQKQIMIGEMKFLRAFIYFNLISRYGGVPIITKKFELNDDFTVSRNTYDECVDFICSELEDAIQLLPNKSETLGKASSDAARALKSRVLLYSASPLHNPNHDLQKWQKASDAASELLDAGYTLHDDYQSIFLNPNNEIIFARYFTQSNYHQMTLFNGRNGSHGWGGNCPTENLVSSFEMRNGEMPFLDDGTTVNPLSGYDPNNPYIDRDPRFYASILFDGVFWMDRETEIFKGGLDSRESSVEAWNASLTGYNLKKFISPDIPPTGSTTQPTNPWIHFRYAEILLNYAEAQFELGNENIALEILNKIRARPSVKMPPVNVNGEELRKKIYHERKIELVFEGHRFFDVRRWKIASITENNNLKRMVIEKLDDGSKKYEVKELEKRSFNEMHYYLPIPRDEVDKSHGSLTQNDGY